MPRSMVGHPNLILETLPEECDKRGWGMESHPKRLWGENEWNNIHVRVEAPKFKASFDVQQMPGCCAVLIASYIDPEPYVKYNFLETIGAITDAAREAGFGSLMLSQVLTKRYLRDQIWEGLLRKDWEMSKPFINAKSGNKVVYLTKNLGQKGKIEGMEIPA
jgi:hypothetical protein